MKSLIFILIIAAAAGLGWAIYSEWEKVKAPEKEKAPVAVAPAPAASGAELPGLPPTLESSLAAARVRGAPGLRDFLARYGKTIRDPRLAWIEMDYVVLVASHNPDEARKTFAKVKQRTLPSSPVYSRIKQLEKTYE